MIPLTGIDNMDARTPHPTP